MYLFFRTITDLGDSGFIGILVAASSVYLSLFKLYRHALSLILSFALAAGTIGLLKFFAAAYSDFFLTISLRSPSGHAAVSTAVYATLAVLFYDQSNRAKSLFIGFLACVLIASISYSRIALGSHSKCEVFVGMITGMIAGSTALLSFPKKQVPFNELGMLMVFAAVLVFFYGTRLNAEAWVGWLAFQFRP